MRVIYNYESSDGVKITESDIKKCVSIYGPCRKFLALMLIESFESKELKGYICTDIDRFSAITFIERFNHAEEFLDLSSDDISFAEAGDRMIESIVDILAGQFIKEIRYRIFLLLLWITSVIFLIKPEGKTLYVCIPIMTYLIFRLLISIQRLKQLICFGDVIIKIEDRTH